MKITLIAAAAENNAIGKEDKLLWHLPDDFKHFKAITSHHYIIMGRKTFETFPKPLPNRKHIVITRQANYQLPDGCFVAKDLAEALSLVPEGNDPFIIGGGEIYKLALPIAHCIELTRVHTTLDGDTFFPEIDERNWHKTNEMYHPKDASHLYDFTFLTYERK